MYLITSAIWLGPESVDMIVYTSDLKGSHLMFTGYAANIGPNAICDGLRYPRFTILGAEGEMVIQRCVGFRHGESPSSVVATRRITFRVSFPALKGRAKFSRRYATHCFCEPIPSLLKGRATFSRRYATVHSQPQSRLVQKLRV